MGIQGLLEFLDKATKRFHISEYKGATVAVDAYSWLSKGVLLGIQADKLGEYCLQYVELLQSHEMRPILVFNGKDLIVVHTTKQWQQPTSAGELALAQQYYNINPGLVAPFIKQCHELKIDCIVAPYEVKAQLAFFNLRGIAELVMTEDPDLTLFGCSKICFNLDAHGNGILLDSERICDALRLRPDSNMFDKFKHMCILSGCDYLEPLEGINLMNAYKFISSIEDTNPETFLDMMPRILNMPALKITDDYKQRFMMADAIFRHEIIFDPFTKKLEPLFDPHIAGTNPSYCRYAGDIYDQEKAYQVALGNLHPSTFEVMDEWDPRQADLTNKSIWGNGPYERSPSRNQQKDSFKQYFSNYKFETIQETDADEIQKNDEEKINQRNLDFLTKTDIFDSDTDIASGPKRFPAQTPFCGIHPLPQTHMPSHIILRPSVLPPTVTGFQTRMPGFQTAMPGSPIVRPGFQATMAGPQTTMPGFETTMPVVQTTMPEFRANTCGLHSHGSNIQTSILSSPRHKFGQVTMPGMAPPILNPHVEIVEETSQEASNSDLIKIAPVPMEVIEVVYDKKISAQGKDESTKGFFKGVNRREPEEEGGNKKQMTITNYFKTKQ